VLRYFDEAYVDRVRGYRGTFPYEKALHKRRVWVEPLFAEAKDRHGMRRFRLRRLERVNAEALMIAAGQNVKRLLTFGYRRPRKTAQAAALRPPGRPPFRAAHATRSAAPKVIRLPRLLVRGILQQPVRLRSAKAEAAAAPLSPHDALFRRISCLYRESFEKDRSEDVTIWFREVEEEMPPSEKANLMVPSPAPVRCTERTPSPETTTSRAPPPSLRISHSSPAPPRSNP